MKKIFLAVAVVAAMAVGSTSCGGGKCDACQDTIVSQELADSISKNIGARVGMSFNMNLDLENPKEFLKGYQLIMSHKLSKEYVEGIKQALNTLNEIPGEDLMELNRDVMLAEVRKYVLAEEVDIQEYNAAVAEGQKLGAKLNVVMEKRDSLRCASEKCCNK